MTPRHQGRSLSATGTIAATLARVAARERWLAVRTTLPDDRRGWHRAADLLADQVRLASLVEDGAQALAGEHPDARPDVRRAVAAALLLGDWSWALAVVGAGSLAVDGRVPDLAPEGVWLQVGAARVTGVAATAPGFWCSPEDPDCSSPPAVPSDDLDSVLRRELSAHLALVHTQLRAGHPPLLRQGSRAMWGAAGDGVATALRLHADTTGEPDAVLAVAERVLAGAPRCWGAYGFQRVRDARGEVHVTRTRTSCCLYYRLPGTPACVTCPRTSRFAG